MSKVTDYPTQGTVGVTRKPKRYDIDIYQGDTFAFNLVLGGTGLNVTGWTAASTVKTAADVAIPNVITISPVDVAGKFFTINVNSELLTAGTEYKYDVQVTDSGSNKRTFIGGKISVDEDITEP